MEEELRRAWSAAEEQEARLAALREEKGAADARCSEVEQRWKATREDLQHVEAQLAALQEEKEQLLAELEQLERQAEEQLAGNHELRTENDALKQKVQELEVTLTDWREAMDELERRLADRSASMDRLSAQLLDLSRLREEGDQLRVSRGEWDATQQENEELERRLQTMAEVLRQREESIEALKKESAEYHSQVLRFSPEIRSLQSNLASVTSNRMEMSGCLERLHSRIRRSVEEHQACLHSRGIDTFFEVRRHAQSPGSPRSGAVLDLPVVETELHRALDQIQHLQEQLSDRAGDLEEAREKRKELEREEQRLRARLEESEAAVRDAERRRDLEVMPSVAELRETGEMIRALEGRVREQLAEKEKWKAAAKELRAKLDTRTSRLEACVKQNCRLKALIKQDEQQAEDRRLDLQKLTLRVEGKNDTISRLQHQLKAMQRELESGRGRAAGQNNSNANLSDASEPSDLVLSLGSPSPASSAVTSVPSSRESVRASAATPVGPLAPLTPALSEMTSGSQMALSSEKEAAELQSLKAKLRATENLNKSLRAELSLAEVQAQALRGPSETAARHGLRQAAMMDSLLLDASVSPVKSPAFEHCLRAYIAEIRSLRTSLEASIAETDQLREALRNQLLDQNAGKSASQWEKEVRRLRERLTNKKRRVVELEAELAGVRARTESSERENVVLRSELQATQDLLAACRGELDVLTAKKGGRREMLRETQRLRVMLERSLESNRRLHDQLKAQQERRASPSGGDFSNCSTPKSAQRPAGLEDAMSDLSAVVATSGSARHLESRLQRCDSDTQLGAKSDLRPRPTMFRRGSARSSSSYRSSESSGAARVDSDLRLLYAISRLEDYELLRKEIQETLCLVRAMRSRICERLRQHKAGPLHASLDYSTLKELQSEVSSLAYFLEQENSLISRFWTAELPLREEPARCHDLSSHVQLMEAQLEMERLRSSNRQLRQMLHQNERRLVATDRAKSDMESALVERLSSTEHVLSAARGTLERSATAREPDQVGSADRHDL